MLGSVYCDVPPQWKKSTTAWQNSNGEHILWEAIPFKLIPISYAYHSNLIATHYKCLTAAIEINNNCAYMMREFTTKTSNKIHIDE